MNKNILKHVIRYVLMIAIIILCCIIFNFSSEDGPKSSGTSGKVASILIDIFADGKNMSPPEKASMVEMLQPFVRKGAHFSIYMLLGILLMCCMLTFKISNVYKFDISIAASFLYACTDELHQRFIPARSGQFTDVCLDTLGSACGILIVWLIVIIIHKIKNKDADKPKKLAEKNEVTNKKRKIMFIASTGGHLNELMQLKPLFKKYDYHIVTEKTKVDNSYKEEYKDKISFLIYGTKKYPIRYIFKFLANCFISLCYFFKYQPEVVITTGTHTAVPMCYIAKIFGSKVIFIETFANRTTGTVAGRLVYPIADTFVVQWDEMLKVYPKAVCWGWIY